MPPARFLTRVRLGSDAPVRGYPWELPVVAQLRERGGLGVAPGVTFVVGENGSGKSTLVEALAVAAGFNAEGGSRHFRFATRATESSLGDHLVLTWGVRKPRTGFFLRAESYYNVATEFERLAEEGGELPAGVSPHARSHGESFVDLLTHRFGPHGLYLLDEPEAALSVQGCLAVLARLAELVAQGCQVVIATHSPILLALPGATIHEIDASGEIATVGYDDALPVRLTRSFLRDPDAYLRHLIG